MIEIPKVQFIWFCGKPTLHWWAYPPDYKSRSAFQGKPIMWRLGLGWVEVRMFPKRPKPYEIKPVKEQKPCQ